MSMIVALIIFALLFFFLEIFVPGGLLAIFGCVLIIAASVLTLNGYGIIPAAILFFSAGILACTLFFVEVKLLTKTPLGKRFRLNDQVSGASLKEVDVEDLKGVTAETLTPLNPSGKIRVQGRIYEAKSDGGWIRKGASVTIINSDVFNVHVRPIETESV